MSSEASQNCPRPVTKTGTGARRIATLLASGTEIISLLGLSDRMVGISHECDYPPEVLDLPVLTRAHLDASASSAEIDRQVREHVASGLSLYTVLTERLKEVRPDLIITQDQCHVCAVSLEQVEAEVREWLGADVKIVSLRPVLLGEALQDVERVAQAAGVPEKGRQVRVSLEARLRRLSERFSAVTSARRPKVLCLEWTDPPMLSGNWMPEIVEAAGGRFVGAEPGKPSPRVEWSEIADAEPEVLLLLPCGFDLRRTVNEAPAVLAREEVRRTPAARAGQVWALDGSAYFNRSGPRLVDSAEILGSVLHPDLFGPPPEAAALQVAV